ncbi:MAG: Energy-coupling factor transporter transmembrane protein EcfT [Firmicutes bacterium ADurb.Bin193]|nr:MAG: Energy-coupling factor transporter transmembrane protein EcfT [Firmicutes bacterium ADurb.Bin193]
MNAFKGYHPFVNFTYFTFVLAFSMVLMHPVCLVISFLCAFIYSVRLNGKKTLKFNVVYMLPMLIIAVGINMAFNHEGATIITYFKNGNPLTLESIVYGTAASVMLITIICWFSCCNAVMTSDKFIYLFGRLIPSLSLILSMTLRLVPKFKAQAKVVADAQRCLGRDVSHGGLVKRARHGMTILSILITWALENAIETADSMKSRGYGLAGRSAFSIYRFDKRDKKALLTILASGFYVLTGALSGGLYFRYFPSVKGMAYTGYSASVVLVYFVLCITPVVIDVWEDRKWHVIKSGI